MKKLTEGEKQPKEGPRRPGLEQPNGKGMLQLLLERQKKEAISRACGVPKQRLRRFRQSASALNPRLAHQQDSGKGCQCHYSEAADCIRQASFSSAGLYQRARSQFPCLLR